MVLNTVPPPPLKHNAKKKAHGAGAHSAQRKHRAGRLRADLLPSPPPREPAELAMPTTTIQKRERA